MVQFSSFDKVMEARDHFKNGARLEKQMSKKKKLILILNLSFALFFCGCSYYTIPTQSLISQIKENQKIERNMYYQSFALIDYPSNNLERIKCVDKKGDTVWLYPDKNTEFCFRKSNGEKVKAYFDTVIFQNDTLYGLRSRLIGGIRVISVNDIEAVTVRAEFPRTEIVNEK